MSTNLSPGTQLAATLAGAWREFPPEPDFTIESLDEVVPSLLGSGAGALGWWRIRGRSLSESPPGRQLRQAYRLHTLHAALHEHEIKEVFKYLRGEGVEPILVKGWAVARVYSEPGLRPYDDIDLIVHPGDFRKAETALKERAESNDWVDLHNGFGSLDERPFEDLIARSRLRAAGDVSVRVLSPEDHLRVLSLHLLRHGAFRPLWLCDIGAALEAQGLDFDWDRCLSGSRPKADWLACTAGLAHRLLGAKVEGTPVARRAANLPGWLVPSVLRQWEKPFSKYHGVKTHRASMATYLRRPGGVLKDLRTRWPDPIAATVSVGGPFNELPRLLFQLGNCIGRTAKFLGRISSLARE